MNTLLVQYSVEGKIDKVKELLQQGADPNIPGLIGETPLITASMNGHLDVVKLLFEWDPNIKNKERALVQASMSGHKNVVEFLLDRGANINYKSKFDENPLIYASALGRLDVVKLLLGRGADPNVTNRGNINALYYSCTGKYLHVAKLLLEHGCNPCVRVEDAPLILVPLQMGNMEMLKLLILYGATM